MIEETSKLKKVIKSLVKECLLEAFAELQIEKIVEAKLASRNSAQKIVESVNKERYSEIVQAKEPQPRVNLKLQETINKLKDTSSFNYYDSVEDNSILTGKDDGPEEVSEAQLASMGLLRDYSKFIK